MLSFRSPRRRLVLLAAATSALLVAVGLASDAQATPTTSAAPALHLGTGSGLPDQAVPFSAAGFRAHETVALHWQSRSGPVVARVEANGTGQVKGTFRVPLPRAGTKAESELVAVGASSGELRQTPFRQRCNDEWTNQRGGDWSVAKDWSTHQVPASNATACITLGSKSYTVTISDLTGSFSVGRLIIGANSGHKTQTLRVNPSGSDLHISYSGTSVIQKRGELLLTDDAGGSPFIDGPGALDNYGKLVTVNGKGWSRLFAMPIVNEPSGTASFALATADGDIYDNNSFTNEGKLTISAGTIFNQSRGFNFIEKSGTITNHGELELNGSTLKKEGGRETGNAVVLNNEAIEDTGGTGSYAVEQSSTFSGNILAGQTFSIVGDYGGDEHFTIENTVNNHGTFIMTSANIQGQSNAWLIPTINGGKQTEFHNYGTFDTKQGDSYNRVLCTTVVNEPGGHMNFDSLSNMVGVIQGSTEPSTLINRGSLSYGAGVQMVFDGPVFGQANFVQDSDGTLHLAPSDSIGASATTAVLLQGQCSGAGCQNEYMSLGGTVDVASAAKAPSDIYLVYDDNDTETNPPAVTLYGHFAHVDGGYSAVYSYSTQNGSTAQLEK